MGLLSDTADKRILLVMLAQPFIPPLKFDKSWTKGKFKCPKSLNICVSTLKKIVAESIAGKVLKQQTKCCFMTTTTICGEFMHTTRDDVEGSLTSCNGALSKLSPQNSDTVGENIRSSVCIVLVHPSHANLQACCSLSSIQGISCPSSIY